MCLPKTEVSGRDDYTPRTKENAMARTKTVVNEKRLRAAISEVESKNEYAAQMIMWVDATRTYNGMNTSDLAISADLFQKRAKEFGVKIKTPRGVRTCQKS